MEDFRGRVESPEVIKSLVFSLVRQAETDQSHSDCQFVRERETAVEEANRIIVFKPVYGYTSNREEI